MPTHSQAYWLNTDWPPPQKKKMYDWNSKKTLKSSHICVPLTTLPINFDFHWEVFVEWKQQVKWCLNFTILKHWRVNECHWGRVAPTMQSNNLIETKGLETRNKCPTHLAPVKHGQTLFANCWNHSNSILWGLHSCTWDKCHLRSFECSFKGAPFPFATWCVARIYQGRDCYLQRPMDCLLHAVFFHKCNCGLSMDRNVLVQLVNNTLYYM